MLVYNQAYDLYHTVFRILRIIENSKTVIEIDKLRILDFYLVFPAELLQIKSFRGFKKYEKFLKIEKNSYERIIDRRRVFYKMEQIQLSAIKSLISYGIIDSGEFIDGKVKRTNKELSKELINRIYEANETDRNIMTLITGPLSAMNLYGHLGLKERTNLIDFKYDAV